MRQQRIVHTLLVCAGIAGGGLIAAAQAQDTDAGSEPQQPSQEAGASNQGWHTESRLDPQQWVGSWLISRDGDAHHVWSLNADGSGRSYAFSKNGEEMRFAYGYDIRWYFDPYTQMANIKTERRIVCRGGRVYPYFLTLKSYESDYAVRGRFAWQTTWTEANIGENRLHKSLVVFVAPLSGWHNPEKDAPCPEFPSIALEQDLDRTLDRWQEQARREESEALRAENEKDLDTTPAPDEPEFEGEEFSDTPARTRTGAKKSTTKRKR